MALLPFNLKGNIYRSPMPFGTELQEGLVRQHIIK